MTKDWDLVQDEIKELSFSQKKTLEEVKEMMERKYQFRASTRAYRMKLKEWGLMRHKPRGIVQRRREARHRSKSSPVIDNDGWEEQPGGTDETVATSQSSPENSLETRGWPIGTNLPSLAADEAVDNAEPAFIEPQDLQVPAQIWPVDSSQPSAIVLDMVEAILDSDAERLERLILKNEDHINDPLGSLLCDPTNRLFGHPALNRMVILQHPGQTMFDVACGMPCGPVVWALLAYGAKGSKHPLGSDLALHNAIKNGRVYTVQALLLPNRSAVNGLPNSKWTPLRQAIFWMHPEVVRVLLNRGANVEDLDPPLVQTDVNSPLQLCLVRRMNNYSDPLYRENCHKILSQLLAAGANVHRTSQDPVIQSTFDAFLQPWKNRPYWAFEVCEEELECFAMFVSKGVNLQLSFQGVPCRSPAKESFVHQALWHSTPAIARLLIDNFVQTPNENGSLLLQEVVGSCPDAKRHGTDTLRDIQVLLGKGISPNLTEGSLISPLRKCITECPAVDLVARLQVLLDGGADPEVEDPDGVQPYILAAETFDEPLLSEVMSALAAKISGTHFRTLDGAPSQGPGDLFPISTTQTYEQVMSCTRPTGDLTLYMQRTVPEHIRPVFRKAYFSVASRYFLETAVHHSNTRLLDFKEKDEVMQIGLMRATLGIPRVRFNTDPVGTLMHMVPYPPDTIPEPTASEPTTHNNPAVVVDRSSPASSKTINSITSTHGPFQFNPTGNKSTLADCQLSPDPAAPASPPESSEDFFIPSITRLRWPNPCAKPQPGDAQKVLEAVLNATCGTCNNGKMLTKKEVERHEIEHTHCADCTDKDCTRRFCAARRTASIT
ncbi:hypothetical protein COCC4DRAFT_75904 [Bipolaris maydis ATCC 48331]|uniref:Clr5 domain-containing protein n=2 Tax=Cochliobolus heterostrophus TaxID=5016 RepID=M2T681_COCH5|nr:uncharacterized protein COCC4DRAFT_75904 [Bipolaris maydis ATCC 48331]EMD93105.1 hypothetical protein COCHEDRAFT_1172970 [Bipolaris maydis C5]KAJ5025849.1 hypothetical protein J3E73DRAFT_431904 [Bipolaris maydis]ENI00301.1 hypothetical protein COCC4DRAFT_75904 [Bipolaris maydis ATCC 48331]KAJ5056382.1 hypothetical protein J3E74DRAFT_278814 [Bipolaris maydis]KAJ6195975.1 hypothetical protein J3E72DRAFT_245064 [Bipolaris maydis]